MLGMRLATLVTLLVAGLIRPSGSDWGAWEASGDKGISIRFAQVNRTTCTWALRNDSQRTLRTFSFRIDDVNADVGAGGALNRLDFLQSASREGRRRLDHVFSGCKLRNGTHNQQRY